MFSCMSGEMVAMAAGEAREPWKDIPIVMSFVYLVPLTLNPFVLLAGAANVNYADHQLPNIWGADNGKMTVSPFVVAVQSSALRASAKALNLFFIITAYTAAYALEYFRMVDILLTCDRNTALYVSSRAVFVLAQMYLPKRAADLFGRTNNGHTPLAAILLCSAFGFISLAGLSNHAFSQVCEFNPFAALLALTRCCIASSDYFGDLYRLFGLCLCVRMLNVLEIQSWVSPRKFQRVHNVVLTQTS